MILTKYTTPRTTVASYETPLTQDYASAACVVTTGLMAPKQIYVFGEKNVLSYNPDNDSWIPGADIPTGRGNSGVAVVNDLIYVIGGETAYGLPFECSIIFSKNMRLTNSTHLSDTAHLIQRNQLLLLLFQSYKLGQFLCYLL